MPYSFGATYVKQSGASSFSSTNTATSGSTIARTSGSPPSCASRRVQLVRGTMRTTLSFSAIPTSRRPPPQYHVGDGTSTAVVNVRATAQRDGMALFFRRGLVYDWDGFWITRDPLELG